MLTEKEFYDSEIVSTGRMFHGEYVVTKIDTSNLQEFEKNLGFCETHKIVHIEVDCFIGCLNDDGMPTEAQMLVTTLNDKGQSWKSVLTETQYLILLSRLKLENPEY